MENIKEDDELYDPYEAPNKKESDMFAGIIEQKEEDRPSTTAQTGRFHQTNKETFGGGLGLNEELSALTKSELALPQTVPSIPTA